MSNPFIVAEDLALKTWLAGVTVSDDKSSPRPVKVWFGYPDIEVRDQAFPFITIDLIDILSANERQTWGYLNDDDFQGTVTPVSGQSYSYITPVAHDLIYQITTFSRHPRHDRALMYQLLNKFPSKYGHLWVPNALGTTYVPRSMFLDGFVKRDTVDGETGNRRLLRNVYTVRVISEMTPLQATAALKDVTAVFVNTTTTDIPSAYTPVQ